MLHGLLLSSVLLCIGNPCMGLRPNAPKGKIFHSLDIPLASQLQSYLRRDEGPTPFFISALLTSLYVASSVFLGYNTSDQQVSNCFSSLLLCTLAVNVVLGWEQVGAASSYSEAIFESQYSLFLNTLLQFFFLLEPLIIQD